MSQTVVNFLIKSGSSLVIDPRIFDFEIASGSKDKFIEQMQLLQTAINNDNTTDIQTILKNLDKWAKLIYVSGGANTTNGVAYNFSTGQYLQADPGGSDPNIVTTTMNRYMAEYVDRIIRTFRSAGWDPVADDLTLAATALAEVKSKPNIYQVATFITGALSAANQAVLINDASTQSQSLQQLLMVDYVSRGNELLFSEMKDLQTAIDLNQSTLSYLNSLQDLMNQKDPQQFLMKLQYLSTTSPSSLSLEKYNHFEEETFKQDLGTVSKFSDGQLRDYVNTLQQLGLSANDVQNLTQSQYEAIVGTAAGAVLDLTTVQNMTYTFNSTNNGINTIINNLTFLINQLTAQAGGSATRLVQSLQAIKTDLQAENSVVKWVQDYGKDREGDYQRRLNDAIVASQSLNDTKREELRRVMFVFEEFYKSATAMLSRITQLLERMASSISR